MDTGGLMIIFRMIGDLDHAFCSPYIFCTRSQRVAALISQIQITVRRAILSRTATRTTMRCWQGLAWCGLRPMMESCQREHFKQGTRQTGIHCYTVYVSKAVFNGDDAVGKLNPRFAFAHIPYYGKEHEARNYAVLVQKDWFEKTLCSWVAQCSKCEIIDILLVQSSLLC